MRRYIPHVHLASARAMYRYILRSTWYEIMMSIAHHTLQCSSYDTTQSQITKWNRYSLEAQYTYLQTKNTTTKRKQKKPQTNVVNPPCIHTPSLPRYSPITPTHQATAHPNRITTINPSANVSNHQRLSCSPRYRLTRVHALESLEGLRRL